jgi:hypothetical protein
MMTQSENLVGPEATVAAKTSHHSHHKSRHRRRIAARIALILGLVIAALAVGNFAYSAWGKADCYTAGGFDDDGVPIPGTPKSEGCREDIIGFDEYQRFDAAALMLAVVLVTGSVIVSRKIPKRRR